MSTDAQGPTEYSKGFDAGFKEGRKNYPDSSNTDDLEAKARLWLADQRRSSNGIMCNEEEDLFHAKDFAAFARSLAQPPSSEMIRAGNVLREVLEYARQTHNRNGEHGRADEAAQAMVILAAISEPDAQPPSSEAGMTTDEADISEVSHRANEKWDQTLSALRGERPPTISPKGPPEA